MTDHVDAIVIGAGAVGLAIARALAQRGLWVTVVERESVIGAGISSRNSEVIHAGIYYPTGSLKAILCVEGRQRLYAYAEERRIDALRLGKLIVAANASEEAKLTDLRQQALNNGVDDLRLLTGAEAIRLEPNLACTAALHSPSSGILDSHAFMLSLQGDLEDAGGMVAFNTAVSGAEVGPGTIRLELASDQSMQVTTGILVNSAGLQAPHLARRFRGLEPGHVPKPFLCKGNYFELQGVPAPFRKLIYPLPNDAGLGIHATTDLAGQNRFGPDTEWIGDEDYSASSDRLPEFETAIRRFFPALPGGALVPVYAGIRPKIVGPGQTPADFMIQGPEVHGIPGLINLFGIESPGLTAALAIADTVVSKVV